MGAVHYSAASGADGQYEVADIKPGTYTVTYSAAGFANRVMTVRLVSGLHLIRDVRFFKS
jgi:iron complex outermembrane receptor protein